MDKKVKIPLKKSLGYPLAETVFGVGNPKVIITELLFCRKELAPRWLSRLYLINGHRWANSVKSSKARRFLSRIILEFYLLKYRWWFAKYGIYELLGFKTEDGA